MRDFGRVFCSIYESPDFRALTEDGRTLVLYLLTCKHATIAGVFRLPDGYACDDLQWSAERVSEGFANLASKGFATRCQTTMWVWVTKFMEWNPPENPNQRKAACKVIDRLPVQCSWRHRFLSEKGAFLGLEPPACQELPGNHSATVPEPYRNKEKEQEQEQQSSDADASGGKPPKSPEEMAKAELWRAAVSVLEQGGCPPSQCRTFMGKLVQDYGFEIVQAAVAAAVTAQPAEAREYLKATCQRLKGERKDSLPITVASDAAERTRAELEARGARLADPQAKAAAESARRAAMEKEQQRRQAAAGAEA